MSAINSLAGAAPTTATANNRFNDLSSDEFIRIMVTELTNQDPFEPNDSAAILEQLSSIRNIEAQNALQGQIESLVTQNAIASAGGFLGKSVRGINVNNDTVQGVVTALRIENNKPILVLDDGGTIAANRLTDVGDLGDLDAQAVQQLLNNLAVLDSGGLIGKLVSGTDTSGRPAEGVVTSIRVEDGGQVVLELDTGKTMPITGVKRFTDATVNTTTDETTV